MPHLKVLSPHERAGRTVVMQQTGDGPDRCVRVPEPKRLLYYGGSARWQCSAFWSGRRRRGSGRCLGGDALSSTRRVAKARWSHRRARHRKVLVVSAPPHGDGDAETPAGDASGPRPATGMGRDGSRISKYAEPEPSVTAEHGGLLEKALGTLRGVDWAAWNGVLGRLLISYDEGTLGLDDLVEAVAAAESEYVPVDELTGPVSSAPRPVTSDAHRRPPGTAGALAQVLCGSRSTAR